MLPSIPISHSQSERVCLSYSGQHQKGWGQLACQMLPPISQTLHRMERRIQYSLWVHDSGCTWPSGKSRSLTHQPAAWRFRISAAPPPWARSECQLSASHCTRQASRLLRAPERLQIDKRSKKTPACLRCVCMSRAKRQECTWCWSKLQGRGNGWVWFHPVFSIRWCILFFRCLRTSSARLWSVKGKTPSSSRWLRRQMKVPLTWRSAECAWG